MIDIFAAFILDAVAGDPQWLPHPVRIMGKYIMYFENIVRKTVKSRISLRLWGIMLTATTVVFSFVIPYLLLSLLKHVNFWLYWITNIILLYTCLAARCLADEGIKIYKVLSCGSIEEARNKLSYIVGRDTEKLDEASIAKAAVETVAENTSDGVIAPLFYMLIGGAPLAFAYKAINTLDSMVGYKNDKYKYFGWASARLDDIANFIPARLSALIMVIAAFFLRYDWRNSWRIILRDRKSHASPNSGYPEAAVAGALGIQLGGTNMYFGKPVAKPTIGDNTRSISRDDIVSSVKIMYTASIISTFIFCLMLFIQEAII
ncbi:MAG: adenosylcobinamide-phosphate synthase CbiB [Bacillota bacterium]